MTLPGSAHPTQPAHLHLEVLGHGPLRVTFLPGLGGTTRYRTYAGTGCCLLVPP